MKHLPVVQANGRVSAGTEAGAHPSPPRGAVAAVGKSAGAGAAPVPNVETRVSSLGPDGKRRFVHTADVKGRFATARKIVFALLVAIWIAAPLVKIGGRPAVLLDVAHRRFYLFGATFNAQDVWLLFFLLTGAVFALAVVTSIAGRVFCGFACPQTVFLDGLFRPIERLVEGPREARMRRDQGPWTASRVARKVVKHALYLMAAFLVAHVALSFFVPLPETLRMIVGSPSNHPEAFAWATVVTLALYGNFAWFREQLCLVVCPYGRLQASLVDADSLVVGYDTKRGEPRGKAGHTDGDCVDCKRCVVVCPTGIDIRNGLQLDCIGCTACIDACDEIMTKLHRPRGLVRYDSQTSFAGGVRRILRPRLAVYAVLAVLGIGASSIAFARRTGFEANITRAPGAPFVIEAGRARNTWSLHLVNKRDEPATFAVTSKSASDVEVVVSESVDVAPMGNVAVPVIATVADAGTNKAELVLEVSLGNETRTLHTEIVRPRR
ncbi:MAG: cytochrome c oxidase accessory protein CcoG [Polyangiaceae bacterium]